MPFLYPVIYIDVAVAHADITEDLDLPLLFSSEAYQCCKQKKYTDIDLMVVSRKLREFSTSAIGACLGLEEATVQTIEQNPQFQKRCDKLHKLLMEWKNSNRKSRWGHLICCLDNLCDDQLMECIKAYFDQNRHHDYGKLINCAVLIAESAFLIV